MELYIIKVSIPLVGFPKYALANDIKDVIDHVEISEEFKKYISVQHVASTRDGSPIPLIDLHNSKKK